MWRKLSRLLFLMLLLTASTPTRGAWTGEGDAINTGQGEEPPPPQGSGRLLPVTPFRSHTEAPWVNATQNRAQPQATAPSLSRHSQSSTLLQFFQSSSFHHAQVGVTKGFTSQWSPGPSMIAPQGHTKKGGALSLPPSSPLPSQRPLWPDPPPSRPPPTPPAALSPTLPAPQRASQTIQEAQNGRRKHRRVFEAVVGITSGARGRSRPAPTGNSPARVGLSPVTSSEGESRALRGRYKALWQNAGDRYVGRAEGSAEGTEEPQGEASRVRSLWNTTVSRTHPSPLPSPSPSKDSLHEELARDFPSEWVLEGESVEEASEELTDAQSMEGKGVSGGRGGDPADTDHQEMTPSPGDSTESGMNSTRAAGSPPVDLNTLELELAGKEEEATSDLLLAISILQHHAVPDAATDNSTDEVVGRSRLTTKAVRGRGYPTLPPQRETNKFNIEIFDTLSPESEEVVGEVEEVGTAPGAQKQIRPGNRTPGAASRYRWFVLVLDGNCSVIKQRMTAFVTFLKAALSSKLSVDYDDVFVPSVFCDKTFMVNISLDTLKNPEVERRLRTLAEANTTLLEISQEIFYLEKILTKRSAEEKHHVRAAVKKPDDMELVIYIAVGCMCVFILLSVVVVVLIRVCRQEGDHLDLGKPHLHQIIPRSLDFPIRRPNVIYSQRFSQALTPGKCGRQMEDEVPASGGGGVAGVAVVAVGGAGRGSYLRYDPEIGGCGGDIYSIGALGEDPYHDRRALVPARKRVTHVPGEDVILEEDLIEEEEEAEEEEDGEDEEEEEVVDDIRRHRRRHHSIPEDETEILGDHMHEEEEEEEEEEDEMTSQEPSREPIRPITTSSSKGIVRTVLGTGRRAGDVCRGRGAAGAGMGGKRGVFSGLDNPCYNR